MEKIIERLLDGFDCCFCRYSLMIRWVHVVQSMAEAVEKAIALLHDKSIKITTKAQPTKLWLG